MIYLPPLTHIFLIKASRETADSRLCQRDAISVREHCGGEGGVPVSQAVAQSRSAKIVCAVAGQLKRNSFWSSLFIKIEEKAWIHQIRGLIPSVRSWVNLLEQEDRLCTNTCRWRHPFSKLTASKDLLVLRWPSWAVVGIPMTSLSSLW